MNQVKENLEYFIKQAYVTKVDVIKIMINKNDEIKDNEYRFRGIMDTPIKEYLNQMKNINLIKHQNQNQN